jgi:hypothetical protein
MGYTHYWTIKGKLPVVAIEDIELIVKNHLCIIQDPQVSLRGVRFNGVGEKAHETFHVKSNSNDFCKTARKPYDLPVCETLLVLKYHLKEQMELRSDGFGVGKENFENDRLDGDWNIALQNVEGQFGYTFELKKSEEKGYYRFDISRRHDNS